MISVFDQKADCCGCTACKSICPTQAIKMLSDEEGFAYPHINQSLCNDCELCKEACSFQRENYATDNFKSPEVYALKHKSTEVRISSSSGGAFSAISDYVLSKNGVIYGAAFDDSVRVLHKRAETEAERDKFRGSKYVQSDLKDIFSQVKDDLDNGSFVVFTGTPCQVAGLKGFLASSKAAVEQLITVDLICHGVPSPLIFADYINYCQEKSNRKVMDYRFRSKVNGWGVHTEEIIYDDGSHDHASALSQTYKELFHSRLCLRPACHNCQYTNFFRPSDITIADFWGIEACLPEFKDKYGVSVVIINTAKGRSLFSKFKDDTYTVESNIEDCALKQPNLHTPTPQNPRRDAFWADYYQRGFVFVIKKYTRYGLKKKVLDTLRSLLKRMGLSGVIRLIKAGGRAA
jgi:coenzyme F420-reducing hydrogenase beta subunit